MLRDFAQWLGDEVPIRRWVMYVLILGTVESFAIPEFRWEPLTVVLTLMFITWLLDRREARRRSRQVEH